MDPITECNNCVLNYAVRNVQLIKNEYMSTNLNPYRGPTKKEIQISVVLVCECYTAIDNVIGTHCHFTHSILFAPLLTRGLKTQHLGLDMGGNNLECRIPSPELSLFYKWPCEMD